MISIDEIKLIGRSEKNNVSVSVSEVMNQSRDLIFHAMYLLEMIHYIRIYAPIGILL